MKKGLCKNKYPRSFLRQTIVGDDSYPIYRRRNDGQQVKVRNKYLDNRWIIPYNPYLLSRYNCHINVEICSGIKAMKYIYKYIYKGHDKISVSFSQKNGEQPFDEIKQYQDGRWVSAPEALWRIFEFDLNEMYKSVCNLQLHLEDQQSIYYKDNQNLVDILKSNARKKSMLTEFFRINKSNSEAKKYLYREIPKKYVWDKTKKIWKPRQRYDQIGRINSTNPSDGERYFLRILLNHVYVPT
ncbi:hypothetical protein MA16_Dca018561 [Dendrobium catenatum]|uniref:Uncharacterized protein n=1 Tax=Dendrobium catenatum TaxID=906689 RepID=A0A2I0WQX5_9ASPA|nr:hypothetical protein MA16_Dca018561 [Dendrobium catenatum]